MGNDVPRAKSAPATVGRVVEDGKPQKKHLPLTPQIMRRSKQAKKPLSQLVLPDAIVNVRAVYSIDKKELGRGHFGIVRKCTHRQSKQDFAVKTIRKDKVGSPKFLKLEIDILKELKHPHIIELVDVFEDEKYVHLVTELCTGGELFHRIIEAAKNPNKTSPCFTEPAAARVLRDSLDAIAYCHARGIVHRDLKPENFLLTTKEGDAIIKIIDFGLSKKNQGVDDVMHANVGTPYYVAPEVLSRHYTKACDVWSLGVIAYIMLCGYPPFYGNDENHIFAAVKAGKFKFHSPEWDHISEDAKTFIRALLQLDPKKRPTAKQAETSPWIRKQVPHCQDVREMPTRQQSIGQMRRSNEFAEYLAIQKLKKATLSFIVKNLTQEDIESLQEAFEEIDEDKNGVITMEELGKAIDSEDFEGSNVLLSEIRRMRTRLDLSMSAPLAYNDFVDLMMQHSEAMRETNVKKAFDFFRREDTTCLTLSDLTELFGNEVQASEVMAVLDSDQDGKATYEDFREALTDMYEDLDI